VAVDDPDATDNETPAAVDRSFGHDGEMDISIGNGSVNDTCDEANNSMVCNFNDSISRDVPTDEHLALSHPVTRLYTFSSPIAVPSKCGVVTDKYFQHRLTFGDKPTERLV
jgi:hypothetical protein